MKGTVKFFNDVKAFGFIAGEDGKEYFTHQSNLVAGTTLREHDKVTFTVVMGDKGPKADQVSLDKGAPAEAAEAPAEETTEESADETDESEETV